MITELTQTTVYSYLNQVLNGEYTSKVAQMKKHLLPAVQYPRCIAYLDFDAAAIAAAGTTTAQLIEELSKYPFVVSAFRSCSGTGIACLVCTEGVETESDFRKTHGKIRKALSHLCEADGTAVNSRRYHYVSYDPDIFVNENPVPFNK